MNTADVPAETACPSHTQSPTEARIFHHQQQQQPQYQKQLGDVYEFHSSPEEEIAVAAAPQGGNSGGTVINSSGGGGGGYFFVNAGCGSSPSSILSHQQKSSSVSSIPAMVARNAAMVIPSPPKRIKTAFLAKKLLAAAVDSNIIETSSLSNLQQSEQRKNHQQQQRIEEDSNNKRQQQQINEGPPVTDASAAAFGIETVRPQLADVEEMAIGDEEEGEYEEEGEDLEEDEAGDEEEEITAAAAVQQPPPRAHSFSCIDGANNGGNSEQKKVPPLRISLLKTPSEDGEAGTTTSSPSASSSASLIIRKSRAGTGTTTHSRIGATGGTSRSRRIGGHRKEDMQRLTRSRVRQIVPLGANARDDSGEQPNRKRRNRGLAGMDGSSNLSPFPEEGMDRAEGGGRGRIAPVDEVEMMTTASDGDGDNGGSSQHSTSTATATRITLNGSVPVPIQQDKEKQQPTAPQKPSAAAQLLAKNSLEQSVGFETMMHTKWARQYKDHLSYLVDRIEHGCFVEHMGPKEPPTPAGTGQQNIQTQLANIGGSNEWPESLKKLYAEQERRRQELAEDHRLDRDRLWGMAQRELARKEEAYAQKMMNITTGGNLVEESQIQHQPQRQATGAGGPLFSIVSYLRDMECYEPGLLADSLSNVSAASNTITQHPPPSRHHGQSFQQVHQRFAYIATTTKNRHTLEAKSLYENQKAEWHRAARRAQRDSEQEQLMMKGPIGGGGGKQSKQPPATIKFPTDLWMETAIRQIQVPDVQLPAFQIAAQQN